jgi:iron(III) transport system substrate-binding protein
MSDFNRMTSRSVSRRRLLTTTGQIAGALTLSSMLPRIAGAAEPLVWYTGSQIEAVDDWVNLFKEKTGITCEYYRAGGLNIAQKFEQEVRAGQISCSLVSGPGPGLFKEWADRGLLMAYDSPELAHYDEATRSDNTSFPTKVDVVAMAYNAEMLSPEEVPTKWEDILDEKWRGKMVMADAGSSSGALHWYSAMRKAYGNEFVEALAKQDVLIRTGNGEVVNTIISGERPLACMVYQYHTEIAISKGANLRVLVPAEGAPVFLSNIAIAKEAPNPEDAKKFIDFVLSRDAQLLWYQKYFTGSARNDLPARDLDTGGVAVSELKRIASSPDDMLEYHQENAAISDEWVNLFKS